MKTVLAIDGGGIRGKIAAQICANLEVEVGPLANKFDLVTGTSTGGIVAAGIASGIPCATMSHLYDERGPAIFSRSRWRSVRTAWGVFGPKYTPDALEESLKEYFGGRTLSDSKTELVIPTFDITEVRSHFFKSSKAKTTSSRDTTLWQACMATSAAPTYFKPFEINGKLYIDGGVHSNNPSLVGLADAINMWPDERIKVLSISTGNPGLKEVRGSKWGLAEWAKNIIPVFMVSSDSTVGYQVDAFIRDDFLRVTPMHNSNMDDASLSNLKAMQSEADRVWSAQRGAILSFLEET